jgi:hypothetical protein
MARRLAEQWRIGHVQQFRPTRRIAGLSAHITFEVAAPSGLRKFTCATFAILPQDATTLLEPIPGLLNRCFHKRSYQAARSHLDANESALFAVGPRAFAILFGFFIIVLLILGSNNRHQPESPHR